ncbi:MAG: hypothetical protein AAFU85_23325 [Planctomycetota bacterium]
MSETYNNEPHGKNGRRESSSSKAFALPDPPVEAPRLQTLQQAVRIRRRTRQHVRTALTFGAVLCTLGFLSFQAERSNETSPRGGEEIAQLPHSDAPSTGDDSKNEAVPFRFFAEVNTRLPVFVFDEAKDAMVPVGWADSSDVMPVDLGPLSNEQMDYFQSVLHQDSDANFISL